MKFQVVRILPDLIERDLYRFRATSARFSPLSKKPAAKLYCC